MNDYISTSLETHLFFTRIMREHALFLLAAFPAGEVRFRARADFFRAEFEKALARVVPFADRLVGEEVLRSGEVFTEFTEMAEQQTQKLTKIPIAVQITQAEKRLRAGKGSSSNRRLLLQVKQLNQEILYLLNGLIAFKEQILQEVLSCSLYTANYPRLIEHILREAKLYRQILTDLEVAGGCSGSDRKEAEAFWNRIMMEHAMFIRGMLDPTECELLRTADAFAGEYCRLLEKAREQDCRTMESLTKETQETTERYRAFKAAGTEGITGCQIRSVILPLLADHVLREANHYLRILGAEEGNDFGHA